MNRGSKRGWLDYLIYLIWVFILFTAIYDLFNIPGRAVFWFGEFILAILIYYKLKVPKYVYLGIMAVFLANLFGEIYFGLFYVIPYFDKLIHLLSPLVACTLFYFLFEKKIQNKKVLIFFSVALLLSWEVAWEVAEYFSDQYFHTLLAGVKTAGVENFGGGQIMTPYEDTIYDMLYNLLGSVVWAIIALFATREKRSVKNKKNKK